MRYLVTGGAGFIGSHLVDALRARGDEAEIMDTAMEPLDDVLQLAEVARWIDSNLDGVFHLACTVGVERVEANPGLIAANIVEGAMNVFHRCSCVGVPVVFTSSSEVYGPNPESCHESAECRLPSPLGSPRWAYAAAKLAAEYVAFGMVRSHGLKVTVARLFNTVGPRQVGDHGMVLPRFVEAAVAGRPLVVHGDGTHRRSFCHVSDTVRALMMLMDRSDHEYELYNVGSDRTVSIRALANMVIDRSESEYGMEFVDARRDDCRHRCPDLGRISSIGWTPKWSLESIVEELVEIKKGPPKLGHDSRMVPHQQRMLPPKAHHFTTVDIAERIEKREPLLYLRFSDGEYHSMLRSSGRNPDKNDFLYDTMGVEMRELFDEALSRWRDDAYRVELSYCWSEWQALRDLVDGMTEDERGVLAHGEMWTRTALDADALFRFLDVLRDADCPKVLVAKRSSAPVAEAIRAELVVAPQPNAYKVLDELVYEVDRCIPYNGFDIDGHRRRIIVLSSLGMASEPLLWRLWNCYRGGVFLDFGSIPDALMGGRRRQYMKRDNYSQKLHRRFLEWANQN